MGVYKPKAYTTIVGDVEPSTIHEAMTIPSWQQVVHDELQALIRNHTWDLVPVPADRPLVGCKWLFKIKKRILMEVWHVIRFAWWLKDSLKQLDWTSMRPLVQLSKQILYA